MNNWNRSFLGINNVVDLGPLTNHILDATAEKTFKAPGIQVIDGPYNSGKTEKIPKIIEDFQQET